MAEIILFWVLYVIYLLRTCCRAAMKMANMDAVLGFMFTDPRDARGKPIVGPNELFYFADVCAGPGGFSEYVLWRKKKGEAKGFGFTLKGPCDFKLENFFAAPSEMFDPYYGVGGVEGDGDIYKPNNLIAFRDYVRQSTDNLGLHFMMADGGFSVEGQENIQEILSKRLYLCQFLAALMNLRPGGHFVCKLFDIFTQFSVGLVYLMYRAFDQVSIFKPVTSRPANSERYIICKGLRSDAGPIEQYMFDLNERFEKLGSVLSENDLVQVVPLELLHGDDNFFEYILTSNERLGHTQVIGLSKIQAFCKNNNLHDPRQAEMREECLKLWKIPDEVRTAPDRSETAQMRFCKLTKTSDVDFWSEPTLLTFSNMQEKIKSVFDHRCLLTGSEQRHLLLSLGKTSIYRWDPRSRNKWVKLEDFRTELPRDTLVEAEIVQELRGENKGQRRVKGLHILDGMFLSGDDITNLHFNERIERLKKFVKAVTRPSRIDLAPIRVKDIYRFEKITEMFERLGMRQVKGSSQPRLCYSIQRSFSEDQQRFYTPTGVHFIKTVKDPWMMALSKSQGMKYFFHTLKREAIFQTPPDSIASFQSCQKSRLLWQWDSSVKLLPEQMHYESKKLSRDHICEFVAKHT
ncbi:Cap-specific mRNA (nucleoside-2'-O-)-methyltransferase 1 [Lamellibrachia satsuma]|nr:Cap-specific mRNA (nucleoside-2'-O-)-methyltransferase 1 [Lamellibrachia satsuma]